MRAWRVGVAALCAVLAAACGDDEGESCGGGEVSVTWHQGDLDGQRECAAIPDECGGTASCDDEDCQSALYRLCSDGVYLGGACADSSSPTIVSCYPDTRPDE